MGNQKDNKPKVRYEFADKESYWQKFWDEERIYDFDESSSKPTFSIDTPPPTVSGSLHLGHVYSYVQAEVIARHRRLAGYNVFYPFGLDNNGLPTERLVEKELGIRGKDMVLADFIEKCQGINEKYKGLYENLWKSIGLSVEWRFEYTTISKEVQKISQESFKKLFEKNLIYKKSSPALYCTECYTSIAQAEVEDKEFDSIFYDLVFNLADDKEIIIATTRPELLPACVAVFVNPEGKHKDLVGKEVITPLGEKVKIFADEKVDDNKGSGIVMCCTYGDETDVYWARKYNLAEKIIIDNDGRIKAGVMNELTGKKIKEARKIIVEILKAKGQIVKELPIVHAVGVHERCGTPIELIPTVQWYLKILDIKDELIKRSDEIKWHPLFMKKRYLEWVNGLKWDWCISRERFFGIPIPVYECADCKKIFVPDSKDMPTDPRSEQQTCPFCSRKNTVGETNVLDTWFTSSQSPRICQSLIDKNIIPMSMRPQAHDIIRTWALYTIVMSHYLDDSKPWDELMISGHVLLRKGEKISKRTGGGSSKPEELIATHSADAIRYAMCGTSLGNDGFFEEAEVDKGKKLVNKIYNAGKLVLSFLESDAKPKIDNLCSATDRWIVARSEAVAKEMTKEFENFQYANARRIFEDFFWREFCDNYLEVAKAILFKCSDEKECNSAKYALYATFLNSLKMASPFMPHITEEMYHADVEGVGFEATISSGMEHGIYFKNEKVRSIHISDWPSETVQLDSHESEGAQIFLEAISQIRKYKAGNQLGLGSPLDRVLITTSQEKEKLLTPFLSDLKLVSRIENLVCNKASESKQIEIEV